MTRALSLYDFSAMPTSYLPLGISPINTPEAPFQYVFIGRFILQQTYQTWQNDSHPANV